MVFGDDFVIFDFLNFHVKKSLKTNFACETSEKQQFPD